MCKFQNISEKKQRLKLSFSPPAMDDDGLLSVPAHVLSHHLGVHGHVVGRQLGKLVRLGVDPAQWLHLLEWGEGFLKYEN
jgi:hypothetical protein